MTHPHDGVQTPVLIAGAGPAGLAAASELAHHGIRSVVVEPRRELDNTLKGGDVVGRKC
jgi:2-polyprenyl-6-methoxyphenol hydroxylase-like FAD-dependent oxidoreductase